MLSPGFALNQGAGWEKRLGPGVNGSSYADAAQVKCRLDGKKIFLPGTLDAGPGDRITIGARVFILKDVQPLQGLSGRLSHWEGELA